MRATTILAALTLLLLGGGCSLPALRGKRSAAPGPQNYLAPTHPELGRILSHDPAARTALVELTSFAQIPDVLAGQTLVARKPNSLQPTARLVASPHRTGRVFGVYVTEGNPAPDDEVVLFLGPKP